MSAGDERMDVPDSLQEEYYQINPDIIGSFPKYRPPLDIFKFKEDVARIMPFFKVGGRLSNEQVEELAEMAQEGLAFVSRADHRVYVKHISYQLDLVLVDKNLKEREIADIFMAAMTMRVGEFLDQPVKPVFDKLHADIMVLTEYLWKDIHRARALFRRIKVGQPHNLVDHSVNTAMTGLAVYGHVNKKNFAEGGIKREELDGLALGLFLHDVGMTKIPPFILEKSKPLTGDERNKIQMHPVHGIKTLAKLDLRDPAVVSCVAEHQERLDGSGYPQRKKVNDLALPGLLCAVADSFSAMVSKRPHAEPMDMEQAAKSLVDDKRYSDKYAKPLQTLIFLMQQRGQLPSSEVAE